MKNLRLLIITSVVLFTGAISTRAADVTENWTKHCASCHGKDGKGQTKAGKMSDTKDLTDAKYQAGFTDGDAHKQIKEGVKDKNGKDRMKPFEGKLTEAEMKDLVAHVRTFKK
jgi:cytochrome c553